MTESRDEPDCSRGNVAALQNPRGKGDRCAQGDVEVATHAQGFIHRDDGNHNDERTGVATIVYAVGSIHGAVDRQSESRIFMVLTMGGSMELVMLAWMLNMYRNTMANVIVVAVSFLLLGVGIFLDRSQRTVDDTAFMQGMIPHHSMAITRAERFNVTDLRVCELAVEISEAQRREILEMDWLINDIRQNGSAATPAEADARSVPDFIRPAERDCPTS